MAFLTKYLEHTFKVEIMRMGSDVVVYRPEKDRFGENQDKLEGNVIGRFRAVYYENNESVIGSATLTAFNSSTSRYEKIPMLIALYDHVLGGCKQMPMLDDLVSVNGHVYEFNAITDIDDLGKLIMFTLWRRDDGGRV